jgi:uncharacterized membrane protein (UPF0127 family)
MRRLFFVLLVGSFLAVGASFSSANGASFPRGTATITKANGSKIVLQVELARTPAQHALGLMNRRTLAPRSGMVFEFTRPTTSAFWMKDTLIPLDIAFYDGRGRILRILTMKPCRTAACPVYDPHVTYRGALEVNAGAMRRWGVARGDRIVVRAS